MIGLIPKEIWIVGISVTLGALASFYIPKFLTADNVALEYAPLHKEEFINIPNLLDGRVEILVDGKPQKNLSVTDVHLFNRSHKDLKEIPLTFEFYNDNKHPVPEVLGKQITKPDSFPKDSITEIPQKDNQYVRYKISSLPVADDYNTDFVASFVFLGDKSPKVRVQSDYTDGKVISIYEYDKDRRERNQLIQILAVMLPLAGLFIIWAIWQGKRDRRKLLSKIGDAAEMLDGFDLPKDQLRLIGVKSYEKATKKKTNNKNQPMQTRG